MFYYHESLNYWQRENPTYVPSRGGLGGGQAQHTQSISQRNSPLMSGNLSKYHLRHKQSVGNQSSQSEPLHHFSGCSLAGGGTLFLTISRWLLSLRLCLSHGLFKTRLFKKMDNFILHLLLVTCTFSLWHMCFRKMQISTVKSHYFVAALPSVWPPKKVWLYKVLQECLHFAHSQDPLKGGFQLGKKVGSGEKE